MTTRNNNTRNNNSTAKNNQNVQTSSKVDVAKSDAMFLARGKVNKIGSVANADSLRNYTKVEEIQNTPILINDVTFQDGFFNGKARISTYMKCTVVETGEEIKVISSAYMVVQQMQATYELGAFPILGQFVAVPLEQNKKRWEFVDVDDFEEMDGEEE